MPPFYSAQARVVSLRTIGFHRQNYTTVANRRTNYGTPSSRIGRKLQSTSRQAAADGPAKAFHVGQARKNQLPEARPRRLARENLFSAANLPDSPA